LRIPLQTIEKEKSLISSKKKTKMREIKIFRKGGQKIEKVNMLDTSTKNIDEIQGRLSVG
jgi:cell fate (sporulation/competence/biofilm development) regulator YmcA (YheA/YmcA/DUF963 family)